MWFPLTKGSFQQLRRRQVTLTATVCLVPTRQPARPSEGRQRRRRRAQPAGQSAQLTPQAAACAQPHVGAAPSLAD
ncbi:Phosphatidylinositol 4-Phosphate 5-Kinase Type-1 Gamma [Manis pentadactyla]|nr:Phosphatidylinositol 4-Phosphate 5-Kinase Type-1 Gamma [Manis pentadactyla]